MKEMKEIKKILLIMDIQTYNKLKYLSIMNKLSINQTLRNLINGN